MLGTSPDSYNEISVADFRYRLETRPAYGATVTTCQSSHDSQSGDRAAPLQLPPALESASPC